MAVSPPPNFDLREALDPFSIEETHRLRRYVELAEELKACRFFQPRKQTLEISFSAEDGMTFTLPHGDDDELITAMAARLRTLHTEGSRAGTASFGRTARLLRAHATAQQNASADWIRTLLDHYEAQVELASNSALIGLVREDVDDEGNTVSETLVAPDEPFWDWMYGVYLHADPEKYARVQQWQYIGAHKFNFLKMASDLARVYFAFSGIVRDVLDEPDLLPTEA
jgi:hypothetical protein